MRNARTTRRRSVKIGLPAALLVLLLAVFAAGCGGGETAPPARTRSSEAASSTWSATPPPKPSTPKPSSPPSRTARKARASASATRSAPPATRAARWSRVSPHRSSTSPRRGDMERLVEEGELVAKDWDKQHYNGIAQNSVVVITVRAGNPEGIKSFEDVLTKDVDVVTPNPFSSGAARWNIMAVYGTADQRRQVARPGAGRGQDPARKGRRPAGQRPRRALCLHPGPGRRPPRLRERGDQGRRRGRRRRIRRSRPSTIQIETPIAVTKDAPEPAAQDFLDFIWSDAGQEIWAENGYRPVNPKLVDAKQFPTPTDLFTIDQFGGWGKVNDEFFDDETGSVAADREGTRSLDERLMEAHPANLPAPAPHPGQACACPGSAPASAAAWSCST